MTILALLVGGLALGCAVWSMWESHLTMQAVHVLAVRLEALERDLGVTGKEQKPWA